MDDLGLSPFFQKNKCSHHCSQIVSCAPSLNVSDFLLLFFKSSGRNFSLKLCIFPTPRHTKKKSCPQNIAICSLILLFLFRVHVLELCISHYIHSIPSPSCSLLCLLCIFRGTVSFFQSQVLSFIRFWIHSSWHSTWHTVGTVQVFTDVN